MHNFPKLPSTFQDTQFNSELNKNPPQHIQQSQSRKITTASQGRNLSPFTWNNIKLPAVLIKEKLQKGNKMKEKQEVKQLTVKKPIGKNELLEATKLQTIGQKAKKALNISMQLKKMLPQKASPLKNLHQKVLVQYQKRKLTTGLKTRQNRSFTQKEAKKMLAKTYETMEVRPHDKVDVGLADSHLLRTEQRYRNSRSQYNEEQVGFRNERYGKDGKDEQQGKKDRVSFRARYNNNKQPKNQQHDKQLIHSLNTSLIIKSPRNSPLKNVHSHSINQQMQPYIRHYLNSLFHSKDPNKLKLFVTTNPKYHPLHLPHNTPTPNYLSKTLIWTKLQSLKIFRQKSPEQYYNHVEGSHILTSKQKLHEMFAGGKGWHKSFYPVSFSLPKEYNEFVQEYDWVLVKGCLKFLIWEIRMFERGVIKGQEMNSIQQEEDKTTVVQQFTVCLSDILDDLTRQTKNQPQLKLLKLCLFLDSGRKKQKLTTFFEQMKSYRSVDITLSQSLYIDIIDWCLQLSRLSQQSTQQYDQQTRNIITNTLNLSNIDYRLIQLLKAYDYLFTTELPPYLYRTLNRFTNSWVIKPFAASKAAGISLVINSQQFYTTPDYQYKQYRHRAKYHNKVFMKYVEKPLLIKHSGMDYFVQKCLKQLKKDIKEQNYEKLHLELTQKVQKYLWLEEKFCGRKFDIRQWVLMVCDEQSEDFAEKGNQKMMSSTGYDNRKSPRGSKTTKRTKFYKYHTAYCRFAQKPYSLTTSDPEVHLTNYQMYKKSLKSDRKSQSPNRQYRSPNGSILEKSDYFSNANEEKLQKNQLQQEKVQRRRLGSISREQKESVLMLEELFEYMEFVAQIKDKKPVISKSNSLNTNRVKNGTFPSLTQTYQTQLDTILQSLFQTCHPHLTHHTNTFQLFGVDLLMDQDSNLYLLQVNLNPGCSAGRDQKLYNQAQTMVETMFQTIMGEEDRSQLQELKHKRIERLQQKLMGSREFIISAESDIEGDKDQKEKNTLEEGGNNKQKKQKKWIIVAEKNTH